MAAAMAAGTAAATLEALKMNIEDLIFRCLERFWSGKYNERYGVVTSYDPKKHAAKVKIKPDDIETGWLPIQAHHVGNGWGVVVGLQVGDQVKISHHGGDFEAGHVVSRVHDDKDKPPKVESGEMLFKHKKAGEVFFDKDHNITWKGANGQVIMTDKKGNTSLSLKVNNDSSSSGDATSGGDPSAGGAAGADGSGASSASDSTSSSDSNAPTYTVTLEDRQGKKHTVTINKDGIAHNSDTKVSIDVGGKHKITVDTDGITHKSDSKIHLHAPTIEHNGNLNVSGIVTAQMYNQGGGGMNEGKDG